MGETFTTTTDPTLRALHVGDLHFWHFSRNPFHYPGKRLLGIGNLLLRRSRAFRKELAPRLVDGLLARDPDWVLFSGDFTTTSLRHEYRQTRAALEPLAEAMPTRLRAVPGNHDRYTRRDLRKLSFEQHIGGICPVAGWPFIEEIAAGLWVIGIDATTSNGFGSFGRVRPETLETLREWWDKERENVRAIWFLCHFPAEEPRALIHKDRGIQLYHAKPLVDFLGGTERPVSYLHGHHHHRWAYTSPTHANLTYWNAGAPLLRPGKGERPDLGFLELQYFEPSTSVVAHHFDHAGDVWRSRKISAPGAGEWIDLQGHDS